MAGLGLRTWNVQFDGGLNSHPDERSTTCFYAPTIGWPSTFDEFLDPQRSPLNPLWDRHNERRRSFTYGHFPLYLGILTGELLSGLAASAGLLPLPERSIELMERANTACEGVAFAGRLMMALLDTLTIFLLFLLGRRLYGAFGGLMAATLYAFTSQAIQLSHFYAMDPASTTFVVLAVYGGVLMVQGRSWRGVLLSGIGAGVGGLFQVQRASDSGGATNGDANPGMEERGTESVDRREEKSRELIPSFVGRLCGSCRCFLCHQPLCRARLGEFHPGYTG